MDLYVDGFQNVNGYGRAFGYIGTDEEYEDEDGDDVAYCGWFFTWPRSSPGISSEKERLALIESLELDEMEVDHEEIPHHLAVARLSRYLEKKFPIS